MYFINHILYSFFGTIGFAILFNIERRKTIYAGIGGVVAWLTYLIILSNTGLEQLSLFFGSFIMGLLSEIMARKLKSPATIFYIPGFITLVPGASIYYSALNFVQGKNEDGINMFLGTLIKSGAITFGLIFASAIFMLYLNIKNTKLKTIFRRVTLNEEN